MSDIPVEQALFYRRDDEAPTLQARSPGFTDAWCAEAERVVVGFGPRMGALPVPHVVFALPLIARQVAIVRVAERPAGELAFHFLTMTRSAYERSAGDPFVVARRVPPVWEARGDLPQLAWPNMPLPERTVAEVQQVLRRVKASALADDEDPEAPNFERTEENSESPALLGGTQVLVDGGKLLFIRPHGDLALVEGLWTLLPHSTRAKLWPASFAYSDELAFDVLVLPRADADSLEGYTTEEQAAQYPPGSYELALQTAAESGDQHALDAVFRRRNSGEMVRLAFFLLIGMMLLVIGSRWFVPHSEPVGLTEQHRKAAAAAGIVAAGEPYTTAAMLEAGRARWLTKVE